MGTQSFQDIFDRNSRVREKLRVTLATVTPAEAAALPEGEKWTIAQIVEHVSMVNAGIVRVCGKLLSKSRSAELVSRGGPTLSAEFLDKAEYLNKTKVEAPEIVHPTGGVSIAESLAKMDESSVRMDELRSEFETVDADQAKFPHPYLGEISATEWLTLSGAHESRHLKQIGRLLEAIRQ